MKKENRKHRNGSRLERFGGMGSVFCVLCFTFLPVRLLTSLIGIASASPAAEVAPELLRSGPAVPVDPNSPQQRELWRAEISVAQDIGDDGSRNELQRMIEKIRSVTFEPRRQVAEPVIVPVEVRPIEPAEPASDVAAGAEDEQEQVVPKPRLPYEPITEKTLQMLRDLSKHPEMLADPFELGETLFLSGNLKEAVVFYTEALNRTEPNDVDPAGNRAWMLFQTGNCLRNSDRPAAAKMYALLITEYPNSPWTQMAQTQARLIDWHLKNEPQKLIAERKQAGGE